MLHRRCFAAGLAGVGVASALPVRHAMAAAVGLEHVSDIGGEGTGKGHFKYVEDFSFTHDGKLLATDAVHAWVQVFDTETGAYLARFGGKGDDDHCLEKSEGIAVDPNGNIFVADYNTGFILAMWGNKGSGAGQFGNPHGVATDPRTGLIYIADTANHRIQVFRAHSGVSG